MKDVVSKQLCVSILNSLATATYCANELLVGDDLELVEATCPDVRKYGHKLAKQVLGSIKSISSRYAVATNGSDADSTNSGSSTSLTPGDIVFDEVSESVDEALEQFNSALDITRGIKNAIVAETGALGPDSVAVSKFSKSSKRQQAFIEMEKPQIHFPDYPIDNSDSPFLPPYVDVGHPKSKEHEAKESSGGNSRLGLYMNDLFKTNSRPSVGGAAGRKHPYEDEIASAAEDMSRVVFKDADTVVYKSLEHTPCTFISTEEELFAAVERIKRAAEIAVDVENHSVRSFQGFTCLIQISTRREDFIIDALALRGSIHQALAPVFASERTVKVLHGADKDVQWLERDFGMYVVNLFDTGQAARQLKYSSASLSFLLARFCDITGTNKRAFQLADWRRRPLPADMLAYARSDTHYLLYIYDRLRTELAKKDILSKVWEKSAAVSRKRYSKLRFDPSLARQYTARFGLGFDSHQTRLLEELCRWRDQTGRREDESLHYVAPLNTLFDIARARDKARTVEGLFKHGFPSKIIPPMVKEHAEDLVRLICNALDAKLEDEEVKPGSTQTGKSIRMSNVDASEKQCNPADHLEEQKSDPVTLDAHAEKKSDAITHHLEVAQSSMKAIKPLKISLQLKASLFDLSSSDSSDGEGIKDGFKNCVHENSDNEVVLKHDNEAAKKVQNGGLGGESTECISQAPISFVAITDNLKPTKLQRTQPETVMNEASGRVQAASKSAFDLSDDESEDDERAEVVAQVRAGIKLRAPSAPVDFKVETDAANANGNDCEKGNELDTLGKWKAKTDEVLPEVEEQESLSLLSTYRKHDQKPNKKRRKTKKIGEEQEGEAERLPAFDYRKAAREEQKTEKAKKMFDPLQRLSEEKHERGKGKVRKSKKRPGSGARSMSFRAR